ncbi:MAG: hypothetical protein ACOX3T_02000 [Bdellovibrionota bacterium]
MNYKEIHTLDFIKNETIILKLFSSPPNKEETVYKKLSETLDVIIKGQN